MILSIVYICKFLRLLLAANGVTLSLSRINRGDFLGVVVVGLALRLVGLLEKKCIASLNIQESI